MKENENKDQESEKTVFEYKPTPEEIEAAEWAEMCHYDKIKSMPHEPFTEWQLNACEYLTELSKKCKNAFKNNDNI